MTTEIELPKVSGLKRVARLVNMEFNDEQKFIRVFYRELILGKKDEIINTGEIKSYEIADKPAVTNLAGEETKAAETAFTEWDNQLGVPVIRPAIEARLKEIYGIS